MNNWICCQIGAREHYAIPRALHSRGKLEHLITDTWVNENSIFHQLPSFCLTNLRGRYHSELRTASIKSFNIASMAWELAHKSQSSQDWDKIIARNIWWEKKTLRILKKLDISTPNITLFAYSYAALSLFKYAKARGWQTVLGQIDPGIIEEKLVARESSKYPQYQSDFSHQPFGYWQDWRKECALADQIIVNSSWSSQALEQIGVDRTKIEVAPLAYKPPRGSNQFRKKYPTKFNVQRPLRVLFLGQVILRKGIAELLETIKLLHNKPIEFWFVGKVAIKIPPKLKKHPQIKWLGKVSRHTTSYYYQQADVFLFPTISDGFGLTQLEAQACQLPIIASQFCGSVVKDRINGLILPSVTAKDIANTLTFCLNNPHQLALFSQASIQQLANFSLPKLSDRLCLLNS